ncbi:MAG: ArsR family transcriptional regulator [Candidatus Micrarchaeota archaeon]|nr:ArsR family transcriptional regulator [Candidatus Micrarchaeota archaeon]
MDEKITLDRETFRVLASETKIKILKSIDERRKTLTELAKELGMSPSTVKEHLDNLSKAGLIEQKDDGHKWKYYELTRQGNEILHPGSKRIMLVLAASTIAVLGVLYDLARTGFGKIQSLGKVLQDNSAELSMKTSHALEATPHAAEPASSAAFQIPWAHVLALIILAIIIGVSIAHLYLNRKMKVTVL